VPGISRALDRGHVPKEEAMTDRQIHVAIALARELSRVVTGGKIADVRSLVSLHGCSWDDLRKAIAAGGAIHDFPQESHTYRCIALPAISFYGADPLPVPLVRDYEPSE
jgi:hypothetical protein